MSIHILRPAFTACLLGLLQIALASDQASQTTVTFTSLLQEMTDRTVVTHWPTQPYRSLQASSYNRASKTPDDPNGWFANRDCGYILRTETRGSKTESVLMEHDGPGVITRIWSPFFHGNLKNKKGEDLHIYIDGEDLPRLTVNFFDLVMGRGPVKPPFAQPTTRAGDLYLPIPFKKSCKITQGGKAFFYIINYRAYDLGTEVESFRLDMLDKNQPLLEKTGAELVNPKAFSDGKTSTLTQSIPGRQHTTLTLPAGPSAVRQLEFQLQAADLPQALRSTVLEMHCDGQQTIWCPLGDFFSNVNARDPFNTWERDVRADGTMVCRWIMPYQTKGLLTLHNLAETPVTVALSAGVSPWKWTKDSLHFRTNWWTHEPFAPRPVFDLNFITVKGRGLHVGDTFVVLNPLWSWWGEGDEKIYVDEDLERRFPSQFGTGTEDYYGWAGGEVPTRKDEFCTPFLALVRSGGETRDWPKGQEPYTHGYNICTRSRSLDATPFARDFQFDMEAFNMIGAPDAYLQYALVTHWYGAPGAVDNRPPMKEAATAPVPQTTDVAAFAAKNRPVTFAIKNAIDFESLKEVVLSPGLVGKVQNLKPDRYPPFRWSGEAHYWIQADQPGGSVTFTLQEQYHPRRILIYPTQAPDYGMIDISVNNVIVKHQWDGYHTAVKTGEPIDLGVQDPDGNVFLITVTITGKNPAARGFVVGLDAVVLKDPLGKDL